MTNNKITIDMFKFKNDLSSLLSYYKDLPIGVIYITLQQALAEVEMQYKHTVVQGLQSQQQEEEDNPNSQD